MKCPKCGYFDPLWFPSFHSRYREYAKVGDFPEAKDWPIGEVIEKDGFAFWRIKGGYIHRKPLEVYKIEGKSEPGNRYWDSTNFDMRHRRIFNETLDASFTKPPSKKSQ